MQLTADQVALQAHIAKQNDAFEARCKANGSTFYTLAVDDPALWARLGITTVEQYEASRLEGMFLDAYKDDNGFHPDLSQWQLADMREYLAQRSARAIRA